MTVKKVLNEQSITLRPNRVLRAFLNFIDWKH